MRKFAAAVVVAFIFGSLTISSPAMAANSTPVAPDAPIGAPAYDASAPPPGPNDLTWSQVDAITSTPSSYKQQSLNNASSRAAAGVGCHVDTGNVYKRSSGSGYPYGTVGGKPRTTCDTLMVRITQTTTLYKTVWWGLQQVAGPFSSTNVGQGTIQQTNVQVVCADLRNTTFRMIVRSTGTFPTGTTGTASAYEEANLPCGTK